MEKKEKNFGIYKTCLTKVLGEEKVSKLLEVLGGEEKVMNATFASTTNTGAAYNGSFTESVIKLVKYAISINELFPQEIKVNAESLHKVCLLSQISKVLLFIENDNNWEIANRGMAYKFDQLKGSLRMGERSLWLCSKVGIEFDEIEFEAMRILDKSNDSDDTYSKYYSSVLSNIVKMANDMVTIYNKERKSE